MEREERDSARDRDRKRDGGDKNEWDEMKTRWDARMLSHHGLSITSRGTTLRVVLMLGSVDTEPRPLGALGLSDWTSFD